MTLPPTSRQQRGISTSQKLRVPSCSSHMAPEPMQSEELALEEEYLQQQQEDSAGAAENDETVDNVVEKERYRQYLADRARGTSRLADSKPPCSACFVPLPVVWFADYIEQNCIFEKLGSFGLFRPSNLKARTILIGAGLVCNVLGMLLSLYVLFAVSKNFDILWYTSFTTGHLYPGSATERYPNRYYIRIGIRAIAVRVQKFYQGPSSRPFANATAEGDYVISFDDFCSRTDYFLPPNDCGACDAASSSIIFSLFVSFIMSFPSITTSVLRLYPHYDCNCQKVFASFAALISVVFAIYTFVIYQFKCFKSFGWIDTSVDSSSIDINAFPNFRSSPIQLDIPDTGRTTIYSLFWAGPGWVCLATSTGCRILDMLFNMAIPTPTICRDREEQREYELLVQQQEQDEIAQDSHKNASLTRTHSTGVSNNNTEDENP